MYGTSKFDHATFSAAFAVSAQKYTIEEAAAMYELEYGRRPVTSDRAAVIWKVGRDEYNQPCAGWWLDTEHDGTEPRYCPVWLFWVVYDGEEG